MSAYDHKLVWNGSTGTYRGLTDAEFTAIYQVFCNSGQDQSNTVISYVLANIAGMGDTYDYANDSSSYAFLKAIAPSFKKGSCDPWIWEVRMEYGPNDIGSGEDQDGNPTDDPLDFRPVLTPRTVQYTKALEKAAYHDGFNGVMAGLISAGDEVCPHNSAGVPFVPGLEAERAHMVVECQFNLSSFNGDTARTWINVVNTTAFDFTPAWGVLMTVAARESRVRDIHGVLKRMNGVEFFEQVWALEINPDTWLMEVVDRGFAARAMAGDPDGRGGTISGTDIIDGVPQLRRLVDFDQQPLTEPVLLNGDGQPLAPGDPPVFLRWRGYTEASYFLSTLSAIPVIEIP